MNAFSSLLNAGMQTLHSFSSAEAVYLRAAKGEEPAVCLPVQVAWGRTEFEEFSERAVMLQSTAEDAIISDFAKLLLVIGRPQAGDRIRQGNRTREVMSLGDEPCFRYDSAARSFLRIHTRVVQEDS